MLIIFAVNFQQTKLECLYLVSIISLTGIPTNPLVNDIEQTANTYKLNAYNKALLKTSKPNLSN